MQNIIRTPFDALIREVLDKITSTTGRVYDPKQIAIVKIPSPNNFFAAMEFYTVETDDDIRVQVYLQEGTDDSSSKLWLKDQADFYCSRYSILYPEYGDDTRVYTYVRTIRSSLVIDEIMLLPTACSNGFEFLTTESGIQIITDTSDPISVTTLFQSLLSDNNNYILTESGQPLLLGA